MPLPPKEITGPCVLVHCVLGSKRCFPLMSSRGSKHSADHPLLPGCFRKLGTRSAPTSPKWS